MTKEIAALVDTARARYRGTAQALHYAIGAMIAHDTAQGRRAFDGIDVERLFAAVQMLRDRDTLEVAPFVASWAPALEGLGAQKGFPSFFGRNLQEALTSPSSRKIEEVFRTGVDSIVGSSNWPETFRWLEVQMVAALVRLCTVDASRVDYLAPLLTLGPPVEVATLNYDRSIEELAARAGLSCDTGISRWEGGADWSWDDGADVRLLKLHGSIDWEIRRAHGALAEPTVAPYGTNGDDQSARSSPAVVFGQRGKLRPDGPFLPMLLEFEQLLGRCTHLLVVGYSFRDDHINAAIRKWLNQSSQHEVTLIDPSPETRGRGTFLSQLAFELNPRQPKDHEGESPRLHVIEEKAAVGLRQALPPGPALAHPEDEGAPEAGS